MQGFTSKRSPPRSALAASRNARCVVFLFHSPQVYSNFSSFLHWLLKSILLNFHIFAILPNFLWSFISNFISLWLQNILCMISVFLIYWGCFYDLICGLSYRTCHVHLRKPCSVLAVGLLCRCRRLSGQAGLQRCSSLLFPCCFLHSRSIHYRKCGIEVSNYCC